MTVGLVIGVADIFVLGMIVGVVVAAKIVTGTVKPWLWNRRYQRINT